MLTQLAIGSTMLLAVALVAFQYPFEQAMQSLGGGLLPIAWAPLLASAVACLATYQLVAAWLLRTAAYRDVARMRIVFAITMAFTQISIPLLGGSQLLGLPAGQAAGFGAGAIFGAYRAQQMRRPIENASIALVRRLAWQFRRFAIFGIPAAVVSNIAIHVPALVLAFCYGLEIAGVFALAQRVFTTPLTLLTNSFSRVFLAEAARVRTTGEFVGLFRTTITSGVLLAAVPVVGVAVLAPWCFGTVFGPEWTAAGWVCTLIAPMVLALAVAQIIRPVFDLVGRQDQRLLHEVLCALLIVVGMLAAWLLGWSPQWAIAAGSVAGMFGYTVLIALARQSLVMHLPADASPLRETKQAA
jgi:O-antigen/teichoic acid export membrane protein